MKQNRRLIDANALIRKICNARCGRDYEDCMDEVDCDFDHFIFWIPTITDVEPLRHGKWIHDINNLYSCSECTERETMSHKRLKSYCPNCGAKMDVKD